MRNLFAIALIFLLCSTAFAEDAIIHVNGWSRNGKVAYTIGTPTQAIGAYVVDLVTDNLLWQGSAIDSDVLAKYNIIPSEAAMQALPITSKISMWI
jgi:hypothetical protein